MAPKCHEFAVVLQRDGPKTQWGIRLVGGSDLNTPLIVTKVQMGSPAQGELLRGDVITKIQDYDARDIRHADAQSLFRSAGNEIRLVVHRDNKLSVTKNITSTESESSRCSSALPPYSPNINLLNFNYDSVPHREPSPFGAYETANGSPISSLPHTVFPYLNDTGGYNIPAVRSESRSSGFSPMPTRDHQQEGQEETAAIAIQPYRTTPLILPGAKVKKEVVPTECYLRHHPNPAIRGRGPHADDLLLRQRVADSVLHRVVGEDSRTGKVAHKQFNSPIGLYSDNNIEHTIRTTVPNSTPYKKTVVFDPSKSETYRALQEDHYGKNVHEIPITVQHQTYQPNRGAHVKQPHVNYQQQPPQQNYHNVNALGESNDTIHQSHSFKRLMYSVLGETD